MSSNIDNRVVSMKFDNKDFESNVKTSLGTLEKLNQTLNKADGTTAFAGLSKAAREVSLDHIANGVETIQNKFSALSIVGITALQNLTNAAISAGTQMVKSLTIDPVTDGLAEYELKMGSVQTIMASTGKDLPTVNGYLAELNEYADKTIYSFSDMTSSIGKFTNNGVELEKAVRAIQGISNEAALSGANAQQASHAMYNFAQALSSGAVKLIDWKSIENANMATVEFKEELIKTALEMGTLVKQGDRYVSTTTDLNGKVSEAFTSTSMFNDSLSAQWMTSEVLVETLGRYADETTDLGKRAFAAAQDVKTFSQLMDTLREAVGSGWAETFELIIGDFDQARALWTDVNNEISGILDAQAKARNDLLRAWAGDELGGREALLDSFENVWNALKAVIKPIKEAFRDVFPPMTAQRLADITKAIRDLTAKLIINGETAELLRRTFRGLFAVLDLAFKVLSFVFKLLSPVLGLVLKLSAVAAEGLLTVTALLGDFLYTIDQWIGKNELVSRSVGAIHAVLAALGRALKAVGGDALAFGKNLAAAIRGNGLFQGAVEGISTAAEAVKARLAALVGEVAEILDRFGFIDMSAFENLSERLKTFSEPIGNAFEKIKEALSPLFAFLADALTAIGRFFQEAWRAMVEFARNGNTDIFRDLIEGGILATLIVGLKKFIDLFKELGSIKDGVLDVLDGLSGCLEAYQAKLKADVLKQIAIAIAILTASVLVLSFIDPEKLETAVTALAFMFAELVAAMAAYSKFMTIKDTGKLTASLWGMMGMALAVVQIAKAVKTLGGLDPDAMKSALAGLGVLMVELYLFTDLLNEIQFQEGFLKAAVSLVVLAFALRAMVAPVKTLGEMDFWQIAQGIFGLGALLVELGVFFRLANSLGRMGPGQGVGLILFAVALNLMASAVEKIGRANPIAMVLGLSLLAGLLVEIGAMMVLMDKLKESVLKSGATLLILAFAINLMANALIKLSGIDIVGAAKALTVLGIGLWMAVKALNAVPKDAAAQGLAFLILGKALQSVAKAIKTLGELNLWTLAKGLGAVVIALAAMTASLRILSNPFTLAAAESMAILALSITLLAPALKMLGSMSLPELGISLAAMAGALFILGAAGAVMGPVVPILVSLGVATALLSASLLAGGMALLLFAKALLILGPLGAVAAGAIAGILVAIAGTIPTIAAMIGKAIAAFFTSLAESAGEIIDALLTLLIGALEGLRAAIPIMVESLLILIEEILRALSVHAPTIANYVFDFLIGVLNVLAERMPELVGAVVNVFATFFHSVYEALVGMDTGRLEKTILGFGLVAGLMVVLAGLAALTVPAMVGVLAVGAVIAEMALVLAAIGALAQIPGLEWLINEGGDFLAAVGSAIGKFIGGIAGGVLEGATSALPKIGADLSAFMENAKGFIDGAKQIDADMMAGVKALAETVLILTAANVLDGLTRWFTGGQSLSKFGEELSEFGPYIRQYAKDVAGVDTGVVSASANAASVLSEMAAKLPNSGGAVSWFTGDNKLSDFGKELAAFGPYISEYARAVSDVKPEAIEASVNAARAMSELASGLPNAGGVASWFTGDNPLSEFGRELAGFAPHIATYSSHVKDVDAGAVTSLVEIAEAIPNSGGAISLFTGDNTLGKFGENLANLGAALSRYSSSLAGVSMELVKKGTEALRELIDLAQGMKNVSFSQMSNFSHNLKLLADGGVEKFIQAFSDAKAQVKNAVVAFVTAASEAMKDKKGELKTAAEGVCAVIQEAMDENFQAERFGANGRQLGAALALGLGESANLARATVLAVFREAMASLDQLKEDFKMKGSQAAGWLLEGFSSGSAAAGGGVTKLSDAFLSVVDGLKQGFQSRGSLIAEWVNEGVAAAASKIQSVTKSLGQTFLSVIDGMKSEFTGKGSSIAGWTIEGLNAALPGMESAAGGFGRSFLTVIDGMKSDFTGRGSALAAQVVEGVQTALPRMEEAARRFCAAFLTAMDGMKKDFNRRGAQVIGWLNEGIASGIPQVETAASNVGQAFLNKLSGMRSAFNQAGSQMISGLNAGLSGGVAAVQNAASSVGQSMLSSLNQVLGINSPAKEGERIGIYTDQGIAQGLLGQVRDVTTAGSTVGSSLTQALNDSLAGLSEDMLADPVIRPVVDLSDVERSAGLIGGMFGTGQTLALAGKVSVGMNAYANQRNQNDLGSVVSGLKNEVASMRETIGELKRSLAAQKDDGNLAGSVGSAVREALSGVSVNMDGQRVGRLVTNHQNSSTRRHGTPSVLR